MQPIILGKDEFGQDLLLTAKQRLCTHMHVVGGSGKGKSYFLANLIMQDIKAGHSLVVLDWHGELCNHLVRNCYHRSIGIDNGIPDFRKLYFLDLSNPELVIPYSPFANRGGDISAQSSRIINSIIRSYGLSNTNETPTFETIMTLLSFFMLETGANLQAAARLLYFKNETLRDYAKSKITDPEIAEMWAELSAVNRFAEWNSLALSTRNKLLRFNKSAGLKRALGLPERSLSLSKIMDTEGSILLVNLGASQYLDRDSARVFASLILHDIFDCAMDRANESSRTGEDLNPFIVYLDEFQEFLTPDLSSMLDAVRKAKVSLTLSHQAMSQLQEQPKLLESVLTNARNRAVFGGSSMQASLLFADEMCLHELNQRQIKQTYFRTIHLYREEQREILSTSESRGVGLSVSESATQGQSRAKAKGVAHGAALGEASAVAHSQGIGEGNTSSMGDSLALSMSGPAGLLEAGASHGLYSTDMHGRSDFSSSSLSNFSADSQSLTKSKVQSLVESDLESETNSTSETKGKSKSKSLAKSQGRSITPFLNPIPTQELASEVDWTLEEKRYRAAEMLKYQHTRHCFIKLDTSMETGCALKTSNFKTYSFYDSDNVLQYVQEVSADAGAITATEADRLLEQKRKQFEEDIKQFAIERARDEEADRSGAGENGNGARPKRRPARNGHKHKSIFDAAIESYKK